MQCIYARDALMSGATPVSNLFIAEYMTAAPEGFVKAYLYGLMRCAYDVTGEDMAAALGMEEAEIAEAFTYWQAQGLVHVISGDPLTVEYFNPVQGRSQTVRRYSGMLSAIQQVLGARMLSSAELAKVYDWVDVFGLEESAVVMLMQHCVKKKGARISVNYMDKVARSWADAGITNVQAAEEHLRQHEEIASGAQHILKRWRQTRRATEDELNLYRSWLQQGFTEETILSACAEMTAANNPSFNYLGSILQTWKLNGGGSAAAIEQYLKDRDAAAEFARLLFERAGLKKAVSARQEEQVYLWTNEWHVDAELLMQAAEYARSASEPFDTMKKLVAEWHDKGVNTLTEARKAFETRGSRSVKAEKKPRALDYMQNQYGADYFESIGVKLLDEDEEK